MESAQEQSGSQSEWNTKTEKTKREFDFENVGQTSRIFEKPANGENDENDNCRRKFGK